MTTDKTTPAIIAAAQRAKQRQPKRRLANDLHHGSHRHIRVRRLITVDRYPAAQRSPLKPSWPPRWCNILIALGLLLCGFSSYYNEENVSNFMLNYSRQYQAILHNRQNYCDHRLPLDEMFAHIRRHVLHQDAALDQLQAAMGSKLEFQSISLLGSSGVGKSLTARLLRELFPWPENVHTLTKEQVSDGDTMNSLLSQLPHCGRNLILLDNLGMASSDQEIVSVLDGLVGRFGDIARHNNSTHKAHLKRLAIVYIFNYNRWLDHSATTLEQFASELQQQQLPHHNHRVIQYDTLQRQHLESCIRHEAALEQLQLDEARVEELLNVTDVHMSGCKTIRAKVLIYGQPKTNNTRD